MFNKMICSLDRSLSGNIYYFRWVKSLYASIKEIKIHVYAKQQTWIFTTWPSFALNCRLLFITSTQKYSKIPKISPSKNKPPQTGNAKNPPLNRPSKYKPPKGLYLENCPQMQSKTKQKR